MWLGFAVSRVALVVVAVLIGILSFVELLPRDSGKLSLRGASLLPNEVSTVNLVVPKPDLVAAIPEWESIGPKSVQCIFLSGKVVDENFTKTCIP